MKRTLIKCGMAMIVAVLAASAFAQEAEADKTMPLAEARAKIGEAIKDPELLAAMMKQMSATNQVAFVAEVNEAISKMPGSAEEKTALALNANKAALRSAAPGNVANILAEIYATAPIEALGVISESFGSDLFNRDADPSHAYTDAQFTAIAEAVVRKISERTSNSDDGGVRSGFGMMMMVNASNGSVENLADTLVGALPADVQDVARNEWIPAATGEDKNYDSMLAYSSESAASSANAPNVVVSLQLAGPQMLDAMLTDVAAGVIMNSESATPILDQSFGGFGDNVIYNADPTSNTTMPEETEPSKQPEPDAPWNPQPYQYGEY